MTHLNLTDILITLRNAQDHPTSLEVPVAVAIEMSGAPALSGCVIEAADALLAVDNAIVLLGDASVRYRELPAKLRVVYVAERLATAFRQHALAVEADPAAVDVTVLHSVGFDGAAQTPILARTFLDLCELLAVTSDPQTPQMPQDPADWAFYFHSLSEGGLSAQEAQTARDAAQSAADGLTMDEQPRDRNTDRDNGQDEEPERPVA